MEITVIGGAVYVNDFLKLNELYDLLSNMPTKKGNPLSPYSIKSYISKLNRVSILVLDKSYSSPKFLLQPDKVISAIENSKLTSKKDYIGAITKLLSGIKIGGKKVPDQIIEQYHEALNKFKTEQMAIRNDNKATPENVEKSIPLDKIKKTIMESPENTKEEVLNKLILAFYFLNTDNLVLRNDLPNMRVISLIKSKKQLPNEFNYLVMDKDKPVKIIMKSYKTSPIYGTRSFNISTDLIEIIKKYLSMFGKSIGDFLFTLTDGKSPISNSHFNTVMLKATTAILGKPIGVDLSRQIVATDWYYKHPLASKNEKDEFAAKFLHSSATNSEYMRNNLNVV